jgi:hypothetical protein
VLLLSLSNESIFYNVWISPSQTHQSNPVWHSWNSSPTLGGLKFHKYCQADILQSLWIVCKSKQLEPTKCMDYKRASVLAYDSGLLFISISISSCCHASCFLCISSWLIFKSRQRFLSHTSWWYAHDFWPNQVLWGKCDHSVIALHLATILVPFSACVPCRIWGAENLGNYRVVVVEHHAWMDGAHFSSDQPLPKYSQNSSGSFPSSTTCTQLTKVAPH